MAFLYAIRSAALTGFVVMVALSSPHLYAQEVGEECTNALAKASVRCPRGTILYQEGVASDSSLKLSFSSPSKCNELVKLANLKAEVKNRVTRGLESETLTACQHDQILLKTPAKFTEEQAQPFCSKGIAEVSSSAQQWLCCCRKEFEPDKCK